MFAVRAASRAARPGASTATPVLTARPIATQRTSRLSTWRLSPDRACRRYACFVREIRRRARQWKPKAGIRIRDNSQLAQPTPCSCSLLAISRSLLFPHLSGLPYPPPIALAGTGSGPGTGRATATCRHGFGSHADKGVRQAGVLHPRRQIIACSRFPPLANEAQGTAGSGPCVGSRECGKRRKPRGQTV